MPVKLRVVNEAAEESSPSEHLFDEDRITIGRGEDNHLTLDDPKRIVSTEHAEIRSEDGTYQLVDLGSKNFTYLGEERLQAGEPHPLQDGDLFSVGNFKIEFVAVDTKRSSSSSPASAGETVFAADFSNPFTDPADQLVGALEEIAKAYEDHPPQRREDALKDAFQTAEEDLSIRSPLRLVKVVKELIGAGSVEASHHESGSTERENGSPVESADQPGLEGPSETAVHAGDEVVDEVIDVLLEALSRVVNIPWQFRHEFIGQTIMQSSETEFIFEGDAATMKKHLLDPSLSQEERRERLKHVEDAAESLAVHQVAMLNGYKASIMNGVEDLMEMLDPGVHREEILKKTPIFEYIPILASPLILDRLQAQWSELEEGDWSVAEQRIFRPAFIKAYLARMTAQPSDET